MSSSNNVKSMYLYHMPYIERQQLCRILDSNDKWKELGGHMQFNVQEIQEIERKTFNGRSPSDELLTLWGHHNHTVLELFVLLSRMQHYRAMEEIKQLVDHRYHRLITDGEQNLRRLFANMGQRQSNAHQSSENTVYSNSNNDAVSSESSKILNIPKINRPKIIIPENSILNNNAVDNAQRNDSRLSPNTNGASPSRLTPQPQGKSSMSAISDVSSLNESASAIPRISYDELQEATDNWKEDNILGRGGFGTVFKGNWKHTAVAIKRIDARGSNTGDSYNSQMGQSMRELRYLNGCRHDNILSLYGYSMEEGRDPCLVYQYMSGGSLELKLKSARRNLEPALTWTDRKRIAHGTAKGLQFLHTYNKEKPLIHGDIKSANILLDQCNEPRIGDFGLVREGPHSDYTHLKVTRILGTRPYLPDDFLRCGKLSTKVDTYSFGVVLFELATGLRYYDESRQYKFLKDHVIINCEEGKTDTLQDMKAEDSSTNESKNIFYELITLGRRCAHKNANKRPEMVAVFASLSGNL